MLFHHFLQVSVGQRASHIPADAYQDHVDWETRSFEVEHIDLSIIKNPQSTWSARQDPLMRQSPALIRLTICSRIQIDGQHHGNPACQQGKPGCCGSGDEYIQ